MVEIACRADVGSVLRICCIAAISVGNSPAIMAPRMTYRMGLPIGAPCAAARVSGAFKHDMPFVVVSFLLLPIFLNGGVIGRFPHISDNSGIEDRVPVFIIDTIIPGLMNGIPSSPITEGYAIVAIVAAITKKAIFPFSSHIGNRVLCYPVNELAIVVEFVIAFVVGIVDTHGNVLLS